NFAHKIKEFDDNDLYNFPDDILSNLISPTWWKEIKQLESLLLPYCITLNKLQCNNAKLHEILHCFELPKHILFELFKFSEGQYSYDTETYLQFDDNILQFWKYVKGYSKKLYKVAQHIFSITVNSASIERIFSIMGWIYSPRRNRLKYDKVVSMTSLHYEMKQARRTKKISNLNVNLSQNNTSKSDNLSKGYRINASPKSNEFQEKIENYKEFRGFKNYEEFRGFENYKKFERNEESNHKKNDNFSESRTYCNVSSEEDTDMDDEDNADDDSMLNKETNLVNINNQEELEMSNNLSVHLAINQTAKWHLSEIFIDQLNIPNFLDIDML
ncbi:352_t:CDS:2, partial [Cetraspora pellucida]